MKRQGPSRRIPCDMAVAFIKAVSASGVDDAALESRLDRSERVYPVDAPTSNLSGGGKYRLLVAAVEADRVRAASLPCGRADICTGLSEAMRISAQRRSAGRFSPSTGQACLFPDWVEANRPEQAKIADALGRAPSARSDNPGQLRNRKHGIGARRRYGTWHVSRSGQFEIPIAKLAAITGAGAMLVAF